MYNYLMSSGDFDVFEVNQQVIDDHLAKTLTERFTRRLVTRLSVTRFSYVSHAYRHFVRALTLPGTLRRAIAAFAPEVVVTVAHGNLFNLALHTARLFKVPLVSVFHDYWPLLAVQEGLLPPMALRRIESDFRRLYRESDGVSCVSEGMRQVLGAHVRAEVILPLSQRSSAATADKSDALLSARIVYAGYLAHTYGDMLRQLSENMPTGAGLQIFGEAAQWSASAREEAVRRGILKPFIPFAELEVELAAASALLVVISFSPDVALLMQTNFPSKIITYLSFEKPLIVWAPTYATAAQFVRQHDCGLVVDDPDPAVFWERVAAYAADADRQQRHQRHAREVMRTVLDPVEIQRKFVRLIEDTITAGTGGRQA